MNRSSPTASEPESAARVPHRCLIKLRGIYGSLKSAERKAADHLIAAADRVAHANIVDFARQAGCSEATIVRLARKLHYGGFPELKADFAQFDTAMPYADIGPGDSPEAVVKKVFANSIQALADTLAVIDMEQYRRAVEAMVKARRLAFVGLGNAAVVAREAYQKFLRLGVPCYTAEDPDLQLIILSAQLSRNDVLVTISYTGESRPVIAAARQAGTRGITTVAITNFPLSTLAKTTDVVLLTAVFQEHLRGEIGSKRLAQLCVIESLYVNYLLRQRHRVRRHLADADGVLELNKTSSRPRSAPALERP